MTNLTERSDYLIAFTDGSCLKNGAEENSGGFGVVILDDNGKFSSCYRKDNINTTNNREELRAILYVMLNYGRMRPAPTVYSDSAYCVNTLSQWVFSWARNGWLKSDNKPPENLDLIKVFYEYYQKGYQINLLKIKGHNGHEWNEIADGLATGRLSVEEIERKYNGR